MVLLAYCHGASRDALAQRYARPRADHQDLAAPQPGAAQGLSIVMSEEEDIEALAGEYVLGTLDAAERAAVAARRQREPALAAAIEAWEQRLAPLDEAGRGDRATGRAVLAHRGEPRPAANARRRRRPGRGRAPRSSTSRAVCAAGVPAPSPAARSPPASVLFTLVQSVWREAQPANFVAVLQKDAASPAFLVEVDLRSRLLTVRPVAAERQAGKSYELWLIHAKLGPPKSLGVIADRGFTVRPALAGYDSAVVEDATYAVTLEPEGGSPTGAPTSAPLWTGKLVQATP